MGEGKFSALLAVIVPSVVGLIAERKNLSEIEASKLFYRSKVYALLSVESTKVWHYGAETVFSMLEDELSGRGIEFPEEAY